jgi:hypothetical protein
LRPRLWRGGTYGERLPACVPDDVSLADRQAQLVAALVSGAPLPPGFDERSVHAMATILRAKRWHALNHALPAIRLALGDEFTSAFERFAAEWPRRAGDSALDDAIDFLGWLRRARELPAPLRYLAVRLRVRRLFARRRRSEIVEGVDAER